MECTDSIESDKSETSLTLLGQQEQSHSDSDHSKHAQCENLFELMGVFHSHWLHLHKPSNRSLCNRNPHIR